MCRNLAFINSTSEKDMFCRLLPCVRGGRGVIYSTDSPANTRRQPNAGLMFAHRLQRWPISIQSLGDITCLLRGSRYHVGARRLFRVRQKMQEAFIYKYRYVFKKELIYFVHDTFTCDIFFLFQI